LLPAVHAPGSVHDQDSARDLVVLRVPAGYCLDLVRLLRDAQQAVLRHVAAATSATRRPKKAR
jgi:hypothetical protein